MFSCLRTRSRGSGHVVVALRPLSPQTPVFLASHSRRCIIVSGADEKTKTRRQKQLHRLLDAKWMESAGKKRRKQLHKTGGGSSDRGGSSRRRTASRYSAAVSRVDFEKDLTQVGFRALLSRVTEPLPRKLRIMIERATDTRITPIYAHLPDRVWHKTFTQFAQSKHSREGKSDEGLRSLLQIESVKRAINHGIVFSQMSQKPRVRRAYAVQNDGTDSKPMAGHSNADSDGGLRSSNGKMAVGRFGGRRQSALKFQRVRSSFRKVFTGRVLLESTKRNNGGEDDIREALELYAFFSAETVQHSCSVPLSNVPPAVFDLIRDYFYNRVLVHRKTPFVDQMHNHIPVITPTMGRRRSAGELPIKLTSVHNDAIHALSKILSLLPSTPPAVAALPYATPRGQVLNYNSFAQMDQFGSEIPAEKQRRHGIQPNDLVLANAEFPVTAMVKKHTLAQELATCLSQLRDFLPMTGAQYLWRRQLPAKSKQKLTRHWDALRRTNLDFYCGPLYFEKEVVPIIKEVVGVRTELHTPTVTYKAITTSMGTVNGSLPKAAMADEQLDDLQQDEICYDEKPSVKKEKKFITDAVIPYAEACESRRKEVLGREYLSVLNLGSETKARILFCKFPWILYKASRLCSLNLDSSSLIDRAQRVQIWCDVLSPQKVFIHCMNKERKLKAYHYLLNFAKQFDVFFDTPSQLLPAVVGFNARTLKRIQEVTGCQLYTFSKAPRNQTKRSYDMATQPLPWRAEAREQLLLQRAAGGSLKGSSTVKSTAAKLRKALDDEMTTAVSLPPVPGVFSAQSPTHGQLADGSAEDGIFTDAPFGHKIEAGENGHLRREHFVEGSFSRNIVRSQIGSETDSSTNRKQIGSHSLFDGFGEDESSVLPAIVKLSESVALTGPSAAESRSLVGASDSSQLTATGSGLTPVPFADSPLDQVSSLKTPAQMPVSVERELRRQQFDALQKPSTATQVPTGAGFYETVANRSDGSHSVRITNATPVTTSGDGIYVPLERDKKLKHNLEYEWRWIKPWLAYESEAWKNHILIGGNDLWQPAEYKSKRGAASKKLSNEEALSGSIIAAKGMILDVLANAHCVDLGGLSRLRALRKSALFLSFHSSRRNGYVPTLALDTGIGLNPLLGDTSNGSVEDEGNIIGKWMAVEKMSRKSEKSFHRLNSSMEGKQRIVNAVERELGLIDPLAILDNSAAAVFPDSELSYDYKGNLYFYHPILPVSEVSFEDAESAEEYYSLSEESRKGEKALAKAKWSNALRQRIEYLCGGSVFDPLTIRYADESIEDSSEVASFCNLLQESSVTCEDWLNPAHSAAVASVIEKFENVLHCEWNYSLPKNERTEQLNTADIGECDDGDSFAEDPYGDKIAARHKVEPSVIAALPTFDGEFVTADSSDTENFESKANCRLTAFGLAHYRSTFNRQLFDEVIRNTRCELFTLPRDSTQCVLFGFGADGNSAKNGGNEWRRVVAANSGSPLASELDLESVHLGELMNETKTKMYFKASTEQLAVVACNSEEVSESALFDSCLSILSEMMDSTSCHRVDAHFAFDLGTDVNDYYSGRVLIDNADTEAKARKILQQSNKKLNALLKSLRKKYRCDIKTHLDCECVDSLPSRFSAVVLHSTVDRSLMEAANKEVNAELQKLIADVSRKISKLLSSKRHTETVGKGEIEQMSETSAVKSDISEETIGSLEFASPLYRFVFEELRMDDFYYPNEDSEVHGSDGALMHSASAEFGAGSNLPKERVIDYLLRISSGGIEHDSERGEDFVADESMAANGLVSTTAPLFEYDSESLTVTWEQTSAKATTGVSMFADLLSHTVLANLDFVALSAEDALVLSNRVYSQTHATGSVFTTKRQRALAADNANLLDAIAEECELQLKIVEARRSEIELLFTAEATDCGELNAASEMPQLYLVAFGNEVKRKILGQLLERYLYKPLDTGTLLAADCQTRLKDKAEIDDFIAFGLSQRQKQLLSAVFGFQFWKYHFNIPKCIPKHMIKSKSKLLK